MRRVTILRHFRLTVPALLAAMVGLVAQASAQTNGTWTNATSGGLWNDTANWTGGAIANGSGSTADFNTLNLTADNTVHLDTAPTIGNLIFGDTDATTAAGWILDNNGVSTNTLTLAGATPTITVNALGTGKGVTISVLLAGTSGFTKAGTGMLTLSGANSSSTGNVTVQAGILRWGADDALPSGTISVASGATLDLYNMTNTGVNARVYSIAGVGTSGQGALIKTTGANIYGGSAVSSLTLTADATLGGSQRFDLSGYVDLNHHVLTKTGTNSIASFTADVRNGSSGGRIVINQGHIYFEGRDVTLSAPVEVNANGTLGCYVYEGSAKTFTAPITLNDGGRLWAGSNGAGGGKTTFAGTIALSGTTYLYTGYNGSSAQIPGDMFVESTVSGTGQLILNDATTSTSTAGSHEIRLNAANTFSGNVRIDRGTLRLGSALALQNATFDTQTGTVGSLSFGTLAAATLGGLKGSNGVALQNDSSSAVALSVGNNNQDTTYSGTLSGAGSLTKIGSGTLALSNPGDNTYTGKTQILGGTLIISKDSHLGAAPTAATDDAITLANGATLRAAVSPNFSLNANRGITLGTGGGTLDIASGTMSYGGRITGNNPLTKTGRDLILNSPTAANQIGTLNINSGRLFFNGQNALGTGAINIASSGSLHYQGTSAPLTLNNAVTLQSGAGVAARSGGLTLSATTVLPTSGSLVFNNDDQPTTTVTVQAGVALTGPLTVQVGGSNATVGVATIQGVVEGAGRVTKAGPGTLALTGANSYAGGTIVNTGTLLVNNVTGSGTGTGDVTVNGGLLGGSGSIGGNVTVNSSGSVSAGMSPGHLAISGNYLQSGTLLAELGGSEQGVSYDWLEIRDSGTATFQPGAVIAVSLVNGFTPGLGDTFDILTAAGGITNSDLTGITLNLNGLPDSDRWTASIVSLGGSAEAIRLISPVPEPATFLLLATGLALLGVRLKSRRK